MKTKLMLAVIACSAFACNKADFGSKTGKRNSGAVSPNSANENPANEPLDVSDLEANKGKKVDGPQAGDGQALEKTIELDCDTSEGVIVDVTPGTSGGGKTDDGKGSEAYDVPGKDGNSGKAALALGGEETKGKDGKDLDTDGNVVGKDGKGGKGGKPDTPLPEQPPLEVPVAAKVIAKVKGKFCPTTQAKLTVLFVVDYSGSMGRHVEAQGQPEVPGNDPQVNGSCGRLRAAQAILTKIHAAQKPGDQVEVGMVPFAGGIVNDHVMPVQVVDQFAAQVSKDTFCQYVIQNQSFGVDPINPGGIVGPGHVDASTNYRAAFTAARSVLGGVYGRKVVYFISDGEPTSGGQDPIQAGINAGAQLRADIDNLTLNALLLGNAGPGAQQVLEQVAGSPDRVRKADNADELANEILKFADASIDEASGHATLTVDPYPRADLGLAFLKPDTTPGVWIYETQPFVLLGKPGVEVLNIVDVTALGKDGTTHSAQVKIRYRQ